MNYNTNYICVSAFGATPATNPGGSMFGQQSTAQTTGGLFASPVSSTSFGAKTPGFGGNLYMYWKSNSPNLSKSPNLTDAFLSVILILNDYIFGEEFQFVNHFF